ncbi:hypothetical protein MWU54_12860 [Marivita sp. S6314]|uniref:hypothetical protein n=1 Tax=Marivita sp. S6314 TaxID=2926406 RepID=UPI001FF33972|nr:hypothetical protein [Marivita sp. S6314]MCK0150923.1 hypothetical protein [Marivita sp. S6314]
MDSKIRTRPDGSIDTGYYMDRGRKLRSQQAHAMLHPLPADRRKSPTLLQRLFG